LVLHLDASNARSYTGSDATRWYGLANNMTCSIVGSPTYTTEGSGSLTFNGTSQYASHSYTTSLAPTTEVSVGIWASASAWDTSSAVSIVSKTEIGGWSIGFNSGYSKPKSLEFLVYQNSAYRSANISSSYYSLSGWKYIVGTCNGKRTKLYIDGVLVSEYAFANSGYPIAYTNNNAMIIAAEPGTSSIGTAATPQHFAGKVANVQIYNNTLTDGEVITNYNFLKGRFGRDNDDLTSTYPQTVFTTRSLVLNLDASNTNSYPGTGANWFNLAPSNITASLVASPTLSTDGSGSFQFNGTTQYAVVRFSPSGSLLQPTAEITYACWASASNWKSNAASVSLISKTESGGYGIFNYSTTYTFARSVGCLNYSDFDNAYIPAATSQSVFPVSSGWVYLTGTYDGRYSKFYVNGILGESIDGGTLTTIQYTNNNAFIIGGEAGASATAWASATDAFTGKIGAVHVYDRTLTTYEIMANFSSSKDKYGY
jgi:hypothetical protein